MTDPAGQEISEQNNEHSWFEIAFNSRYTIIALLILGLIRTALMFLAFAPADGADGMRYYLYAAYMNGAELPQVVSDIKPLYSMFLYFNYYIPGNFSLLIVWQFLMSASLPLLYYLALRRIDSVLAVLTALVILGDAQVAFTFNFMATEPLYVFLLGLAFLFSMLIHRGMPLRQGIILALATGITLAMLQQTRTVGLLIVIPVGVLVALRSRNLIQIGSLIAGYGLSLLTISLILAGLNASQSGNINRVMIFNWLNQSEVLTASDIEAGSSTGELQTLIASCNQSGQDTVSLLDCMQNQAGSEAELSSVMQQAYTETAVQQFSKFASVMVSNFTKFLKLTGNQIFTTDDTPAMAQCRDLQTRTENMIAQYRLEWSGISVTEANLEALDATINEFVPLMCPPYETNSRLREVIATISFRYRSLSRPNPYAWYAVLALLILFLPSARKYWYPAMMAGGLLAYHATISAAAINVQERYVMVTNPFKAILLLLVIVIIGRQIFALIRRRMSAQETDGAS